MIFLHRPPFANAAASPPFSSPPTSSVLLVNDNDAQGHGDLIEFFLEREGFRVIRLLEEQTAEQYLANEPAPGLILLDCMHSRPNGLRVLGQIRAQAEWDGIPVLVMCEETADRDIALALDHGANDCMVKPRQPRELAARIRNLLQGISKNPQAEKPSPEPAFRPSLPNLSVLTAKTA